MGEHFELKQFSFYLKTKNKGYLEGKADDEGRSVSNYLDRMLDGLREQDESKKERE